MTRAKILQLIALADEFEQKTQVAPDLDNPNRKYQVQREILAKFYDSFRSQLRSVLGHMEADLLTLRQRGFAKDMQHLLGKVYHQVANIYTHLNAEKPYAAAQELVGYLQDRAHRATIDNLEFLARHHLQSTKPETLAPLPTNMRHILAADSLRGLKEVSQFAETYMKDNPLIVEPITTPPPARTENPAAQHPAQRLGPEEKTRG